jgi:hypothetical protein
MTGVLGRVAKSDLASPRGPDAIHRVRVPKSWLGEGATVELELPRHLSCAACEGGGCDVCQRSGALTLRGRNEPSDLLQVSLPRGEREDVFVIRIPGRGGLPPEGSELPRGLLLLRVEPSAAEEVSRTTQSRGGVPLVWKVEEGRKVALKGRERQALVVAVVLLAILVGFWLLFRR